MVSLSPARLRTSSASAGSERRERSTPRSLRAGRADIEKHVLRSAGLLTFARGEGFHEDTLSAFRFYGSRGTHVGTGHASCLGDRFAGQIDRRMCLARLPKSLAFSDKSRM